MMRNAFCAMAVQTFCTVVNPLTYQSHCSCKARLGSYNWAGSQSESGAWVTPAFQLHHSKLDAMSAEAADPNNIRRPLIGPLANSGRPANQPNNSSADLHQVGDTEASHPFVPVDAARTVSDAARSAAHIASNIERPALVPQLRDKLECANANVL